MREKTLCIFLILLTFISCNSKQENIQYMKPLTTRTDSTTVPSFKVQLNLSDKAESLLKNNKETIIVDVEFIGTSEKKIPQKYKYEYYDEIGQVTIGKKTIELTKSREISFDSCKVSQGILELLENKTYDVKISVVSGRKSSKDNLLDCDHIQQNIDSIKNQNIQIKGKLIRE